VFRAQQRLSLVFRGGWRRFTRPINVLRRKAVKRLAVVNNHYEKPLPPRYEQALVKTRHTLAFHTAQLLGIDMVRAGVFQEYRDARFMKSFYDDPEKWARLKTHEKSIAHQLANEIKAGSTNLHAKISNLRSQIDRALGQDPDSLGDDDLRQLEDSARYLEARLTNVPPFRRRVRGMIDDIFNASLEDLKHVTTEDLDELTAGIDDLRHRMERLTKRAAAS
jgi:hypothetical protein